MSEKLVNRKISPAADIAENENEYNIKLDMPGVKRENISITLSEGKLEIEGKFSEETNSAEVIKYREFSGGDYYRGFTLGADIEPNGVTAKYDNGVLSVTMKKREEVKPRKIELLAG